MPLYIPKFIEAKYIQKKSKGQIKGSVVITDISGFTSIAEELVIYKDKGIESLSEIINLTFSPAIEIIHNYNGWISHFAGDAFTAIFDNEENAESACLQIRSLLNKVITNTLIGKRILYTKTSIASGSINWEIIHAKKAFFTVFGQAIELASLGLKKGIHSNSIPMETMKKKRGDFLNKPKVLKQFYTNRLIENEMNGEFRNIAIMFISFASNNFEYIGKTAANVIINNGGYFNKLENGDKGSVILGIFGAPIAYNNNEERALDAGIKIITTLNKNIKIKIGMCAGIAYTGFVGNRIRGEYTAIGEVVNRASRIMSSAKWNTLRTDKSMHNNSYKMRYCGKIKPKGYLKGIAVYTSPRKQEFRNTYTNIRKNELNEIENHYNNTLKNKKAEMLFISGKDGSGKLELVKNFAINRNINLALINCDNGTNEPLRQFFDFLSIHNLDSINKMTEEYKNKMKQLLNSYSYMAGLEYNKMAIPNDPKLIYENASDFIARAVLYSNNKIIVFNNADLIDNDSINIINKIIKLNQSELLIVFIVLDASNTFSLFPDGNTIKVGSMTDEDLMDLCKMRFNGHLSYNLFNLIKEKTGSYIVYVEKTIEAIKGYVETNADGFIDLKDKYKNIQIDLNSIIISQLDQLPKVYSDTIKAASVIGNQFNVHILNLMIGNIVEKKVLNKLCKNNIIELVDQNIYRFKHGAIRDSIYKMQLNRERILRHNKAAKAVIIHFGRKNKNYFALIAYHYEMGEKKLKALKYYIAAGDFEKSRYLNDMALKHYKKAIILSNDDNKSAEILFKIAQTEELIGKWERAYSNYEKALKISEKIKNINLQADIHSSIGALSWTKGEDKKALINLKKAIRIYRKVGNIGKEAYVIGKTGNVYWKQGEYKKALNIHKKQIKLCNDINNKKCLLIALGSIAAIEYSMGNYKDAINKYKKQLKIIGSHHNKQNKAIIYGNLGNIALQTGNYNKAQEYNMKRLKIAEQIGDRLRIAVSLGVLGNISRFQNKFSQALMFYEQALIEFKDLGYKNAESITIGNMGICYWRMGDYGNAMKYYEEHYRTANTLNDLPGMQRALGNISNVLWKQGKLNDAIKKVNKQLEMSKNIGDKQQIAIATGNKANILRDKGELKEALHLYNIAIKTCKELGIKPFVGTNLSEKSQLLIKMNKMKKAKKTLKELRIIANELNDKQMNFEADIMSIHFIDKNAALEKLKNMEKTETNNVKLANIYYNIYLINWNKQYAKYALTIYKKLIKKADDFEYKNRINELKNGF